MIIGTIKALQDLKQAVKENVNIKLSDYINTLKKINNFLDIRFEFLSYINNKIKIKLLSKTNYASYSIIGFMKNDILTINTKINDKNKLLFIRFNNKYFIGKFSEDNNKIILSNSINFKTLNLSKKELKLYDFEVIGQLERISRTLENKRVGDKNEKRN